MTHKDFVTKEFLREIENCINLSSEQLMFVRGLFSDTLSREVPKLYYEDEILLRSDDALNYDDRMVLVEDLISNSYLESAIGDSINKKIYRKG